MITSAITFSSYLFIILLLIPSTDLRQSTVLDVGCIRDPQSPLDGVMGPQKKILHTFAVPLHRLLCGMPSQQVMLNSDSVLLAKTTGRATVSPGGTWDRTAPIPSNGASTAMMKGSLKLGWLRWHHTLVHSSVSGTILCMQQSSRSVTHVHIHTYIQYMHAYIHTDTFLKKKKQAYIYTYILRSDSSWVSATGSKHTTDAFNQINNQKYFEQCISVTW